MLHDTRLVPNQAPLSAKTNEILIFLAERQVTGLKGKSLSIVAVLGVADLTLGRWGLESPHWLRDTLPPAQRPHRHHRSHPPGCHDRQRTFWMTHLLNGEK